MSNEQMRMEVVDVTPELAEHLLLTAEAVPHRPRTMRRIAGFAGAMTRGQWQVTHQPIAIDPDGALIDGQHRLSAVVAAGIPVSMLVAYNVPRETFAVIDAGQARSTGQALYIAGHTDVNVLSAAVRAVLLYDTLAGTDRIPTSHDRARIMTPDVLEFLSSERGEIVKHAIGAGRSVASNVGRNGLRSWLTAGITLIYEATPDDPDLGLRNAFIDALHTGAMLPPGSPILRFRRWLISDTGYENVNRNNRQPLGIAALIQTWNAWTQGRTGIAPIRHRLGRDIWPVVGDKPDDIAARDAERDALFAADADALERQLAG